VLCKPVVLLRWQHSLSRDRLPAMRESESESEVMHCPRGLAMPALGRQHTLNGSHAMRYSQHYSGLQAQDTHHLCYLLD